jgi:hypothetical protein
MDAPPAAAVGTRAPAVRRLLAKIDLDRAVAFGLLGRIWIAGAGPITAIVIATYFTPEIQGYHYTFSALLALQVLVELGLGTVIIQFSSHEWSRLRVAADGTITGDSAALSRLASIARIAGTWFAIGGGGLTAALIVGGSLFFSTSSTQIAGWAGPWLSLCLVAGTSIFLVPAWAILEGCNQVAALYTFRLVQSVVGSTLLWAAISGGAGLWSASISGAGALVCGVLFVSTKYRNFFRTLLAHRGGAALRWREDMLPMQWRIALSWISGNFIFSMFTPVVFRYDGAATAGQFGMTWAIAGTVMAMGGSWLWPRVPTFGMLIAQRRYEELDRLFWRTVRVVLAVSVVVAAAIWAFVFVLHSVEHPLTQRFAARILSPLPTALLLAGQIAMTASVPFSTYLRAHKREPLLAVSVASGILMGCSTVLIGKYSSVAAITGSYFLLAVLTAPTVIAVWHRCRNEWHA